MAMSLKCRLKIKALNSLTDGRYFAALGAEWLSFCFDPESSDFVSPQLASEIIPWLAGPEIIANFGQADKAPVMEVMQSLKLQRIEFNGAFPKELNAKDFLQVYRRIEGSEAIDPQKLKDIFTEEKLANQVFVLDWSEAIANESDLAKHDPPAFQSLCQQEQIIISIKPLIPIADQILTKVQPLGLEIAAGKEQGTGLRSFEDVDPLMEWLDLEEQEY